MRHVLRRAIACVCCCVLLAACARPAPPKPVPQAVTPEEIAAQARVGAEVQYLRSALAAEVPRHTACGQDTQHTWIAPAQAALAAAGMTIDHPQLLVVVDRSPRRQQLCIVLARAKGAWEAIGGSKVSTGQAGRRGYFITPLGVFVHSPAILDYRAEGTFNENHIRGLGLKGMRVWDFGWHAAPKGWSSDGAEGEIRLLLHATDPDYLEARLGRPASKGCIRVPAAMNRFLDRHGVLDASYERAAGTDALIRAVLRPDRVPTPLAGDVLVVIETGSHEG